VGSRSGLDGCRNLTTHCDSIPIWGLNPSGWWDFCP